MEENSISSSFLPWHALEWLIIAFEEIVPIKVKRLFAGYKSL